MFGWRLMEWNPLAWFAWWFVVVPVLVVAALECGGCHGGPFR